MVGAHAMEVARGGVALTPSDPRRGRRPGRVHVYTLVIARCDPSAAHDCAHVLLTRAVLPQGADYWTVGRAWFEERFAAAGLPGACETGVARVTDLPRPLPAPLDPALLVTPDGRAHWRPMQDGSRRLWARGLQRALDRHRQGHCVIAADVHF
jgi:hypothetical protein